MPADGSLAANIPEPNVPAGSDRFSIPPQPKFSGGESMAEAAVSNAARDIQNKIEASIRNNMAGFNSPQDAGKPGQPYQSKTGDGVFAYNVPEGRSGLSTLSTSGAYGKMDVEVVEVSTNQGIIFRVTQLKYPTSAKRKLKNAEKVLHEAAESILSQRQNSSVKSSRLITDFACPGVEYEFQADSITGFSTCPNRIAIRVYLLDVSMYLFQIEVPGDLDYSQVDGVVKDFLDSIALSSGDLPPSTARALAGREPDAEEVQAIAHMEKIYDGLIKTRSQKEAQLLQDFKDMLEKKESKSARAQVVPDTKLLSWRVHILPLIGKETLYRKFRLKEPWDSSHNRKLLDSMPQVYECPGVATQVGMTVYQKPDGPGTVWGREKAGTFSTETVTDWIFLLEVDPDQAIEWTRPDDFSIEAITVGSPLVGIGHVRSGGFLVNDGYFLSFDVDLKLFRDLCLYGTRVRLP